MVVLTVLAAALTTGRAVNKGSAPNLAYCPALLTVAAPAAYNPGMNFIRILMVTIVAMLVASTVMASPTVEAMPAERNAELQAQVDEFTAAHDVAQEVLAQAQAARDTAQASLDAANAELTAQQASSDTELLDTIAGAVEALFQPAVVTAYLSLIDEHGQEGAAELIAERLGVDAALVAPLLIAPAVEPVEDVMPTETPAEPEPEPEPVEEAPAEEAEAPVEEDAPPPADEAPAE